MKYRLVLLPVVPALAILAACSQTHEADEGRTGHPKSAHRAKGPPADNSRCHVCHINYEEEELAVNHAKVGVGCETCHGTSDAHCGDENNVTAPDILYARADIKPACMKCHPTLPEATHKAVLAGTSAKKYCTDCHGEHRLGYRERRWDKKTRKLIPMS